MSLKHWKKEVLFCLINKNIIFKTIDSSIKEEKGFYCIGILFPHTEEIKKQTNIICNCLDNNKNIEYPSLQVFDNKLNKIRFTYKNKRFLIYVVTLDRFITMRQPSYDVVFFPNGNYPEYYKHYALIMMRRVDSKEKEERLIYY